MRGLAMLLGVTIGGPLAAQPCAPPPELAGWTRPAPLVAATAPGERNQAGLVPGRTGGTVRYAGLATLTVKVAGTYRIALGGPAWVDVVANGAALPSVAHGHGPECSSVRKMVDFALAPGRYVVQLSDAPRPVLTAMAVRLPG